ncbi:unnamed protein product [Peniophora sp. CBMAI 1063]|nr:unnamed protein product [Peniophora sp. CBMAI 1063]
MQQVDPLERPPEEYREAGPIRFKLGDRSGLPYGRFNSALAAGVPVVISGLDRDEDMLSPEYLSRNFGSETVNVINTLTYESEERTLKDFLDTFADSRLQEPPLKLKVLS